MFWNKKKGGKSDSAQQQDTAADYGLVNNNGVNYFMVLAGGYLVYLGWKLLKGWYSGEDGSNPIVAIGCGILFIAVGIWVVLRQWQAYKKHQAEEAEEAARAEEPEAAQTDEEEPSHTEPEEDGGEVEELSEND